MAISGARVGGKALPSPTFGEVPGFYDGLTFTALPVPSALVGNDPAGDPLHTTLNPQRSRWVAPARPALRTVAYYLVDGWGHWKARRNNGVHGVVTRSRPGTYYDTQRPMYRSPRYLRSAPASGWDAGTAIGADGKRGAEG